MDWREGIFATIEHWTAEFNKWTAEYPPLLILRLLGGGDGPGYLRWAVYRMEIGDIIILDRRSALGAP